MVLLRHLPEENAMKTDNAFVVKFAASIVAMLGCFDRVIFKGHLPFGDDSHLNRFVDRVLQMPRKDFLPWLQARSDELVAHAHDLARAHGAPYQYLQGRQRKEDLVQQTIRERRLSEGLVCVLCCQETCRTVKLRYGQARPTLTFTFRPQRVLYFYWLDPDFGLRHVRVQTWFPFTCQVYVNGHDWLARQLHQHRVGFVQQDNAFTQLDDPTHAQQLADRFPQLPWVKLLDGWVRQVNPLLGQDWLQGQGYYWVIDQAEYSTDVLFQNRQTLAELYPRLLDHACLHFSAQDILTFLGRRLHPCFDGEVLTDCKKDRWPGARIKHRVKNNWLKMYDKFGQVLRIETVINNPREFKVRRRVQRQGRSQMDWCPMNKGVANFYHYHEVARTANDRYLRALAVVDRPQSSATILDRVSKPARLGGHRRRGLNLLRVQEQTLFRAVLRGEHHVNGFRNRDIQAVLFPTQARDVAEQRRRTAQVSRLLQLLRAHRLIAKIPHAHRYRTTTKGEAVMSAAIYARYKFFPKELQDIA
jgi:hypothetical protein